MKRKRLSPAERELRSEAAFLRGRREREAKRLELTAATWRALDKTAWVTAARGARIASMADHAVTDRALRRRVRIKQRYEFLKEYRDWLAACPVWLREPK